MNTEKKEAYVQPALVKHELLRDITAKAFGVSPGNSAFGLSHRPSYASHRRGLVDSLESASHLSLDV
jgi:hypothetical protein